jgi:hypothetical protein
MATDSGHEAAGSLRFRRTDRPVRRLSLDQLFGEIDALVQCTQFGLPGLDLLVQAGVLGQQPSQLARRSILEPADGLVTSREHADHACRPR